MSSAIPVSLDWPALAARPWSETGPFVIDLNGAGDRLHAQAVLRHLPGRRLAVKALWRGETVFAKLFFAPRQREAGAESRRHQQLQEAGLPVPELLFHQEFADGAVVICDWVDGQPGSLAIRGERDRERMDSLLDSVFSLYQGGLMQRDLHLDNFLFDGDRFLVVDPGEIVPLPGKGWRRTVRILDNLALFCAQAPLALRPRLQKKVRLRLRREGLPSASLSWRARRRSRRRLRAAMAKWRRASSAIAVERRGGDQWFHQRDLDPAVRARLSAALRDPQAWPLIKAGSRVSVHGDDTWVIKHYRDNDWKIRLRQRLFKSRADISWVMGWTWALLGVPTPRPVMLRRCADGQAVIAFPRVTGTPLSVLMEDQRVRAERVAPRVRTWLARLGEAGFWHGDAKAQNILVDDGDQPIFIDLDGAGFAPSRAPRQAERDRRRFEANWAQFRPRDPRGG